ncbi:SlyX family protein [Salinisphaera sp.]|uniref:SlyX family protein n=1 Tax=Salinisphaera sp. TaxID=1914330 RepID=UPI002D79F621|nr:SlyX family protein [Salinisphaera sp.]HET7315032.1 SlyX family protein [Salinisphaera sp.]
MSGQQEELEMRIAYQDDAIEQLSRQMFAQSREIERLSERCRQLEERVQRLAEGGPDPALDEQPPHY